MMKNTIIAILLIGLLAVGGYFIFTNTSNNDFVADNATTTDSMQIENTDQSNVQEEERDKTRTVIGTSVEGNEITAYHYGQGGTNVFFVAGLHGGYEWNTSLLATELMDYLEDNPDEIPDNVRVTVIPTLNPDGLESVVGTTGRFEASDVSSSQEVVTQGRFNANGVDLNRNFDCDWQKEGTWQQKTVSGGSQAFSEPESQAFKAYVDAMNPEGVVVWYSSAGGVFASSCHNDVSAETKDLTRLFANASGYPAYEEFDFYEITGDAVNWLAKEGIPAISVLLTNHTDTEFNKNLAGVKAVLEYYAE